MKPDHSELAARVSGALEAGRPEQAWEALSPHGQQLGDDPRLAALWLTMLRVTPTRPTLEQEAGRVIAAWPAEPDLVLPACDALLRRAELAAPDELPPPGGPADRAAEAARGCLEGAPTLDAEQRGYLLVNLANGLRLSRRFDEAQVRFEEALALDPERGGWWFNLGLMHKARGDFARAASAFAEARRRLGDERGVLWNTALCATALGEGGAAVDALAALGHAARLGDRGMPVVEGLPPVQVRAASVGSGLAEEGDVPDRSVGFELLWVTPLSPCHGVVTSASYRVASVDFGDVVLWDGTPVGVGEHEGRPVPRFPLLAVLRKGDEHRLRFVALQQGEGQVAALGDDLPEGATLFIHREQLEMICARCASGESMRKHDHLPPEEHRLVHGKIVLPGGADLAAFRADLDACLARHTGVQIVMPELLEALGDTAAAGKAHQMWRGLQRTALKARSPG